MRRPERLAERIREAIIEIVGYELKDPRVQSVTVTDVVVSDNMREAKVFVMVEGSSESEIRETMQALRHAEKFVRGEVAISLNLHHAPHIHFARDTVEEKAIRVEELLEKLEINKEDDGDE